MRLFVLLRRPGLVRFRGCWGGVWNNGTGEGEVGEQNGLLYKL